MAKRRKVLKNLRQARDKARRGTPPENLASIKAGRKLTPDELTLEVHRAKQASSRGKPVRKARKQEMDRRDRTEGW